MKGSRFLLPVLCGVLSAGSLIAGLIWIREARQDGARQRTLDSSPSPRGGCPNESSIGHLMLAASTVESGVRRSEGNSAAIAGIVGLGMTFLLLVGALLRLRWVVWPGLLHATGTALLAGALFFVAWHGDAKAVFLLWVVYGAAGLGILPRMLQGA